MDAQLCSELLGKMLSCAIDAADAAKLVTDPWREAFLKHDYAETKDLAKHFLTLVSAILVFSLTFSEKIVDFPRARKSDRRWMMSAWVLFIASVSLCGLSLCFVALAGGSAAHGISGYLGYAQAGWVLLLLAGSSFVMGLMALLVAAWRASKRPAPPHISTTT